MSLLATILSQEVLLLREGERWMRIPCAWGVDPSLAFVPSAGRWNEVVPDWLLDRRAEALEAIESFGLISQDDDERVAWVFGQGQPSQPSLDAAPEDVIVESAPMDRFRRRRGPAT